MKCFRFAVRVLKLLGYPITKSSLFVFIRAIRGYAFLSAHQRKSAAIAFPER
jgi:hypothetical protein